MSIPRKQSPKPASGSHAKGPFKPQHRVAQQPNNKPASTPKSDTQTALNYKSETYLQLSSPRARANNGHPWAYSNEAHSLLPEKFNGQGVPLRDHKGRFLGMGIYNSQSQICWRRYTLHDEPFDADFLRRAIANAIARRDLTESVRRIVWSEADSLPGLVIDQYERLLVVQALTLGMDKQLPQIEQILRDLLSPEEILYRNDAPSRRHEGLPLTVNTASGKPLSPSWLTMGGIRFQLDLLGGHKTGFYLDQRDQHLAVARLAQGKRVLDCFCNQGGFALHSAKAGATEVLGLDSSEQCIALAQDNARQNKLENNTRFEIANVFDWLSERSRAPAPESLYDLIILDPPSFARNAASLAGALRGYRELHLRALKLLRPGGYLATYCCSHSVSREAFWNTVTEAAADTRRLVRLHTLCQQPADHPILITCPETEYLKGFILQVE